MRKNANDKKLKFFPQRGRLFINNMPQTISKRVIIENVNQELNDVLNVKFLRKKIRGVLGRGCTSKIPKVKNTSKLVRIQLFRILILRSKL